MKTVRLSLLILIASFRIISAQIIYDTVSVRTVGPGMKHYHIVAPAIPWNLNVLSLDLKNPYVDLESVKANDRLAGHETVRSMANRKSSPGREAIGAINGDFYSGDGSPTNVQVVRGEFVRGPANRPAIGFTLQNEPLINTFQFTSSVAFGDTTATIHGVNTSRGANQMILYNSFKGASTGTNEFGSEALVRPLGQWLVNDSVSCVVESLLVGAGNTAIPPGWAVLSGHGTSASNVLSRATKGDTIRLYPGVFPSIRQIQELVGGYPDLVVNGFNDAPEAPREPRTAAGFSQDSTILYLITVDGRQTISVGMTFKELADFMVMIGVHRGVNLDGGGSTTMVVRDEVLNSPSDGAERAVSNALMVMSSAPSGPLSSVSISPKSARLFRRSSRSFGVFANDQYGNPVPFDPSKARFSCDALVGDIDSMSGLFNAGEDDAEGYVYLEYEGMRDSALVIIKTITQVFVTPTNIVTDTSRVVQFRTSAFDSDGLRQNIPVEDYQWVSTNTAVVIVPAPASVRGVSEGEGAIVATIDGISDTAFVRVEVGERYEGLDSLERASDWGISAAAVDSYAVVEVDSFSTLGGNSLRLSYSFTGSAATIGYIYLDTDIPLFGVPDSVIITGRTENHSHRVYYVVEDDDGEEYRLYSSRLMNKVGVFDTIRAPLVPNQELVPGSVFNFPVRIKRIEIQLVYNRQAGIVYNGTLFLDDLRVSYPKKISTSVFPEEAPFLREFSVSPNYPNPFNPSTSIRYTLPERGRVTLGIYDVSGRLIRSLIRDAELPAGAGVATWDGRNEQGVPVSTGTYFYRLYLDDAAIAGKMMMVK